MPTCVGNVPSATPPGDDFGGYPFPIAKPEGDTGRPAAHVLLVQSACLGGAGDGIRLRLAAPLAATDRLPGGANDGRSAGGCRISSEAVG
jgi:hypothetical protein